MTHCGPPVERCLWIRAPRGGLPRRPPPRRPPPRRPLPRRPPPRRPLPRRPASGYGGPRCLRPPGYPMSARSSTRSTPGGRVIPTRSMPSSASGPPSTATRWAFGSSPATPTAWPSCGTAGSARTGRTSTSTGCRAGSGPSWPTTRWPRPWWPCGRSSSGTRPTTPGSAAWWPRRSRPGWSNRCGPAPTRWSTSCSTPPSRPERSICSSRSPTRCRCGSSATCWASPSRTRSASVDGRRRSPAASIPTSC